MAKKRWNLSVDEDEIAMANANAERAGLHVSQYVEQLIRRAELARKLNEMVPDEDMREQLRQELGAML